jgi:ferredoxin-NADP reductase
MTAPVRASRPSRWQEAVIERVVHQTPRVASVFLRAPLAPHLAGQHVDVRLTAPDGYQAERSYSIASAPGSEIIELAIERLEDGEVSPFFTDVARAGDTIELRGPIGGHFVWRSADGGPLLLVGGGSGIAPLMSIVRHRAAAAPEVPTLLVYSARGWEELIFRDELLAAQASQPNLSMVITTTREPRHRANDYERRLDRAAVRETLDRWGHAPRHAYVCGSNAFVGAVSSHLVTEGVPAGEIRTERYGGTG